MIEFNGQLNVAAPAEYVFGRLADMDQLDQWNPNVTESQRTTGDRLTVGSTYRSTIRRGSIRMTAHSTLTEIEPGRSVTYEGSISMLWSVDSLTFEPAGEGTRITFHNHTIAPRWLRLYRSI